MNKIMKKSIAMLLAAFSVVSLASCGQTQNSTSAKGTDWETVDNSQNHIRKISETGNWLMQNGKTDYTIVLPAEDSSRSTAYARNELVMFFEEATGVELQVITDTGMQHSSEGKYISIGNTELLETSGLTIDYTPLREDGCRVITKDKTIYLVGGTGNGTLNATYELLGEMLGFEAYYKSCYDLNKDVKHIKLMNYDITEIPDIPLRRQGTGAMLAPITSEYEDTMYKYRMRATDSYSDRMISPRQRFGQPSSAQSYNHNSWIWLPKDEYLDKEGNPDNYYPEFYSTQGNQLCYTARGKSDKYEKMLELMTRKTTEALTFDTPAEYPKKNAILVGMEDNLDWCECGACKDIIDYYGAESATILLFCNDLAERVHAWMDLPENAAYRREDFDIMFFAYSKCLKSPFLWNEEKQAYVAKDDKIIPHENVTIYLAVSGFDHGVSLNHKNNIETLNNVKSWTTYMDKIFTWCYGGFIQDYFSPVDVYSFYADTYNLFYSVKTEFNVSQQHSSQRGADSAFFIMAGYVGAKLMWNSQFDVNKLINDYMNAMYKKAAPYMMQLFNLERTWFAVTHAKNSWTRTHWWLTPSYSGEYWSIGYINQCMSALDSAYNAIERYEGEPELYELLKERIDMEWLHPAKVAIDCFRDKFSDKDYQAMRNKFKDTTTNLGMNMVGETSRMDTYINGWAD